jgi:ATP-binding cassette subfamily C protein
MRPISAAGNRVSEVFQRMRPAFLQVGVFSALINVLMLTGSIYMLQVYDRVLASRSVPTLVAISLLALLAYGLQGILDSVRARMLSRIGARFDAMLAKDVARAIVSFPLRGAPAAQVMQPARDLDSVRGFLGSTGPTALLDMPFLPLFIIAVYWLHPWLGYLAIGGALIIVALTLITEQRSKEPAGAYARSAAHRHVLSEAGRRSADAIAALGMRGAFIRRYLDSHGQHVRDGLSLSDSAAGLGAFARVVRFVLQSAVLGLGAYLAVKGEVSPGAMIAASILTSRALAPIEVAVANWKSFVAARQGYSRLKQALPALNEPERQTALPAPRKSLEAQDLTIVPPGTQTIVVAGASFTLSAGDVVGIIGPSGSGKSSLARALVGVWAPVRGAVRLDGALLTQWEPDAIGRSIGYLPQDIELFDGTIAENIARLDPEPDSASVLKAARSARAHDLIVNLPQGYETRIGEGGAALSGGQRQRIALARAFHGDPFLIVLDEPNANLDAEGDEALTAAIREAKGRGAIVVVVTHRPSGLAAANLVIAMQAGKVQAFGPRDEVLKAVLRQGAAAPGRPPQADTQPASAGRTMFQAQQALTAPISVAAASATQAGKSPGAQTPGAQTPGAQTPGAKTPGGQNAAGSTSASKTEENPS